VYRVKNREKGLVITKVFAWVGRHAPEGKEKGEEEKKLGDLAGRYGCSLVRISSSCHNSWTDDVPMQITCKQGNESGEFTYVVGGILVTRQARPPLLLLV
jgi:hypothetical protein